MRDLHFSGTDEGQLMQITAGTHSWFWWTTRGVMSWNFGTKVSTQKSAWIWHSRDWTVDSSSSLAAWRFCVDVQGCIICRQT